MVSAAQNQMMVLIHASWNSLLLVSLSSSRRMSVSCWRASARPFTLFV